MKVVIAQPKDRECAALIAFATRCGYTVQHEEDYRSRGSYFVEVLTDGWVYRAPDVAFDRVPSGTYLFNKDGSYVFVG